MPLGGYLVDVDAQPLSVSQELQALDANIKNPHLGGQLKASLEVINLIQIICKELHVLFFLNNVMHQFCSTTRVSLFSHPISHLEINVDSVLH